MSTDIGPWYCDVCGELINDPDKAYVIWKSDEKSLYFDFKIIHKVKCDLKDHISSTALPEFLGADGLSKLLAMLSYGIVIVNQGIAPPPKIKNIDEYVDLIRRIQTPNYEQARSFFSEYDADGANEFLPYTQKELLNITKRENS
jgi:hypothetical protein